MTTPIKHVTEEFSVSGQLTDNDVDHLASRGIKSLICNRPDGEANDQPNVTEIGAAAERHGIRLEYLPIITGQLSATLDLADGVAHYNGYGSCPLTVERGKIVLAEFGYGGKLLPSFPRWIINGKQPSRLAWILKEKLLPPVYWQAMLKGKEWMVEPKQAAPSSESV